MSTYRVAVHITPRRGILDPQGKAVEDNLPSLGFSGVSGVRVGKHIELTVEADDDAAARAQVEEMAARLLSNPVIEDFTMRVE